MKLKDLSKKNKIIIIVGIIILFIALSPMIGKGIENTTRALLPGLTTEQQIETVADVVDVNKLEAETKLVEQQAIIDAQNAKLAEQQKIVDEQKSLVEKTNVTIVKNRDCGADVTKYCYTSSFRSPEEFANFLKAYEKMDNYSEYKTKFTKEFNNCQTAMRCE